MARKLQLFYRHGIWILLILIAMTQFILSKYSHLSPWKGGGFAMFAAVSKRAIACYARDYYGMVLKCKIKFSGKGESGPLSNQLERSFYQFPTLNKLKQIGDYYLQYEHVTDRTVISFSQEMVLQNNKRFLGKENREFIAALKLSVYEVKFDNSGNATTKDLGINYQVGNWP